MFKIMKYFTIILCLAPYDHINAGFLFNVEHQNRPIDLNSFSEILSKKSQELTPSVLYVAAEPTSKHQEARLAVIAQDPESKAYVVASELIKNPQIKEFKSLEDAQCYALAQLMPSEMRSAAAANNPQDLKKKKKKEKYDRVITRHNVARNR
jgi:hypothetical protein